MHNEYLLSCFITLASLAAVTAASLTDILPLFPVLLSDTLLVGIFHLLNSLVLHRALACLLKSQCLLKFYFRIQWPLTKCYFINKLPSHLAWTLTVVGCKGAQLIHSISDLTCFLTSSDHLLPALTYCLNKILKELCLSWPWPVLCIDWTSPALPSAIWLHFLSIPSVPCLHLSSVANEGYSMGNNLWVPCREVQIPLWKQWNQGTPWTPLLCLVQYQIYGNPWDSHYPPSRPCVIYTLTNINTGIVFILAKLPSILFPLVYITEDPLW